MLYRGGINLMTTGNAESVKSDALEIYRLNGTFSDYILPGNANYDMVLWQQMPAILLIISLMSRITSMSLYAVRIYA